MLLLRTMLVLLLCVGSSGGDRGTGGCSSQRPPSVPLLRIGGGEGGAQNTDTALSAGMRTPSPEGLSVGGARRGKGRHGGRASPLQTPTTPKTPATPRTPRTPRTTKTAGGESPQPAISGDSGAGDRGVSAGSGAVGHLDNQTDAQTGQPGPWDECQRTYRQYATEYDDVHTKQV